MPQYVVAVDTHALSAQLFDTAAKMALQADAELLLLAVFDPPLVAPVEVHPDSMGLHALAETNLDEARSVLRQVKAGLEARGVRCTLAVRIGDIVPTVLEVVEEVDATMLIVATHGRTGIERFVRGSVAEQLLRHSVRPVLVVRILPHG